MFTVGDLVKVKSHSVEKCDINFITYQSASYMTRHVSTHNTGSRSVTIEYREVPLVLEDEPVGEVIHMMRHMVYVVQVNNRTYMCLPDELELVYSR